MVSKDISYPSSKFSGIDDTELIHQGVREREEEKQIWWSWDKLGIPTFPRLTFNFARVNPFTLSNPHFFLLRGESCTFFVPSWHWISSAGIPSFSRLIFSSLFKTFNSSNDTIPAENTSLTTLLRTFWQN